MRHIPALMAVLLTAVVPSLAWMASAGAQEEGDGSKSRGDRLFEREGRTDLNFIPLRATDSRRFEIEWVVLGDGLSTVFADASEGVRQEDQDRLDLSFIPFINQVTGDRYTGDDVSARTRVGSAWVIDRTLLVALDRALANILSQQKIVVLNGKWAYVMATPALPLDQPNVPALAEIGKIPLFRDFAMSNDSSQETRTALIGGLDTQAKVNAASRVPGLGDIPTLGRLFLGSVHQRDEGELILFIKPSIIVPDE